ncbi:quinol monooxygenase YgiN [Crossiella equi]|uniref:Quinol monooxygenase YgiN n=1 Tax=Crossiella equi TaxID=130796 RepID=A0ABS5ABV4_9PSEU|nr:antibiotic biosynthesis monooxygenase [Crossiella equi]MBP2474067.1 quinol monooxygenase YgiN [Crossiella equi]
MLLVCRFAVPEAEVEDFLARAKRALELLTASPYCRRGRLARATDEADRFVLVAEFDSVPGYRKALSPFEVREHVVPLLSQALADEPAAYEELWDAVDGTADRRDSLVALDANTVRLGEAGGPALPRH